MQRVESAFSVEKINKRLEKTGKKCFNVNFNIIVRYLNPNISPTVVKMHYQQLM